LQTVVGELLAVYPLTQEGSGPIPVENLKAIEAALERYRSLSGGGRGARR